MTFWVVTLLSYTKNHLILRRMYVTASRHLFSFQGYKGLNIPNQWDIEKGLEQEFVASYDYKASFMSTKIWFSC